MIKGLIISIIMIIACGILCFCSLGVSVMSATLFGLSAGIWIVNGIMCVKYYIKEKGEK